MEELPLGLYWKGKRTIVDRPVLPFQHLEMIETINESRATREKGKGNMFYTKPTVSVEDWRNKLIWGDNKYAMSALLEQFAGKVDLIYIDPPFATGANFSTTVSIGDGEVEHTKEASAIEELAYRDTWGKGLDSFLQMMYDRLVLMRELLSDKGSIYVHCDYRTNSHIRLILDEIFGYDNYQNEIVWHFIKGASGNDRFGRKHQTVFWYSKNTNKWIFNRKDVSIEYNPETLARAQRGEARYNITYEELLEKGKNPGDVWMDIHPIQGNSIENTNYSTQKPEKLLERIIKASSNEGDLIADFFCGSGTTAAVAEKLNRRWITSDLGRYAIHTTRKRMLEIEGCKPFEILNIGKYERQYWQISSFGKKTSEQTLAEYIAFILKLYKAEPVPASAYIHGKKGKSFIHVGSVEAPVTLSDVHNAIEEVRRMRQTSLVILGWEWEMGLHDVVEQEAKKAGIQLSLLNIPREIMDKRAVDNGDVQFFEMAYLETDVKQTKTGVQIILKDFVIPNLDLIPKEVKKLVKKWSDFIDYWSVDWDYKNDVFHNQWQSYRTKKDRTLELKTDVHTYEKKGVYKVMIKVIDIFGNDTTQIVEVKV
jgi:adenine-specific DNA-methyltransferase